jgi:hypothetical protein
MSAATANAAAGGGGGGIGFNKMFVMLPVMLAARKLDSEDVNTVYWLRISYLIMQLICSSIVVYTYYRAATPTNTTTIDTIVYVPPAPQVRERVKVECKILRNLTIFIFHFLLGIPNKTKHTQKKNSFY